LVANGVSLRLQFKVDALDQQLLVELLSIDQKKFRTTSKEASSHSGEVNFDFPDISARYHGKLSGNGVIEGCWIQFDKGTSMRLVKKTRDTEQGLFYPDEFDGFWEGHLDGGALTLRLILKFERNTDSVLLISPDQGASKVFSNNIQFERGHLRLKFDSIQAEFSGGIDSSSHDLTGIWFQGGERFQVRFRHSGPDNPVSSKRYQEPNSSTTYFKEDVEFEHAGRVIAGELVLPHATQDDKCILVIMVSGSGAQDRNSNVFGHKPFLVLADQLGKAGISSFRYDDRGIGGSTGNFDSASRADLSHDLTAIAREMKSRKRLTSYKIYFIGHSDGGVIAALAAQQVEVDGLVLLSTPIVRYEDIFLHQFRQFWMPKSERRYESDGDDIELHHQEAILRLIKQKRSNPVLCEEAVRAYLYALDRSEDSVNALTTMACGVKMRESFDIDMARILGSQSGRILAIFGSLDMQVDAKSNQELLLDIVSKNNSLDLRTTILEGINHLLQPAISGEPREYASIETTLDPKAIDIIRDWLRKPLKVATRSM